MLPKRRILALHWSHFTLAALSNSGLQFLNHCWTAYIHSCQFDRYPRKYVYCSLGNVCSLSLFESNMSACRSYINLM